MQRIIKIILFGLLVVGWVYVIFNLGKNNLPNNDLWFDESGQIWMAKGLNHFSPPQQKEGDIFDVIRENANYNLDPGGFTIILHYWLKISDSVWWIRILPYLFFILSNVVLALITYYFSRSTTLSLLSLYYLPIIKGQLIYYAFEVRAFSMEYLGFGLSILFLLYFLKKKTKINLLVLNTVLAFFCSSRYTFIVYALTISLITFFSQKNRLKKIILYTPLVWSIVLIGIFSLRIQTNTLKNLDYATPYLFKYLFNNEIYETIKYNLFSNTGIYSTGLIILGFIVAFNSRIKDNIDLIYISLLLLVFNFSFSILSFLGIHPWSISTRWNISAVFQNSFSLFIVLGYFYKNIKYQKNRLNKYSTIFLLFIIIIFSKYIYRYLKNTSHYFRESSSSIYSNIIAQKISMNNLFYISQGDIPSWKYLNEFGALKNDNYPQNTIIGKLGAIPSRDADYIIQSGRDDVDFNQEQFLTKYINITVYEPSRIYKKVVNK